MPGQRGGGGVGHAPRTTALRCRVGAARTQVNSGAARLPHSLQQHGPIAVEDARPARRGARVRHFVPRREHAHPRQPAHSDTGATELFASGQGEHGVTRPRVSSAAGAGSHHGQQPDV